MIERHGMIDAQKLVGVEPAQHQVGVGDGGFRTAAGRSRSVPAARRRSPGRPAACPPHRPRRWNHRRHDRVHVDHRHVDRHRIFELELARDLRHGILDQADIGRGAAHVVGDQVGMSGGRGRYRPPPSRPRPDRTSPCSPPPRRSAARRSCRHCPASPAGRDRSPWPSVRCAAATGNGRAPAARTHSPPPSRRARTRDTPTG